MPKPMDVEITYEDEDGCDVSEEVSFPTVNVICDRCDGEGKHVNPAVDGHGISAEEWERDWDDEGREGYLRGDYDVVCHECKGAKVLAVPDEEQIKKDPELLKKYELWQEQEDERSAWEAEDRTTRRMESGGYDG